MEQETINALLQLLKSPNPKTRYDAINIISDNYDERFADEVAKAMVKEEVPMLQGMIKSILKRL